MKRGRWWGVGLAAAACVELGGAAVAAPDRAGPGALVAADSAGARVGRAAKGSGAPVGRAPDSAATRADRASAAARRAAGATSPYRVEAVTVEVFHRVFHDFHEQDRVTLNQEFRIGDTEYTARIVRFVPDFAMDMKTRAVISRSAEPNNPAFRIIVKRNGQPQDTTWALLKMPPHFAVKSMLAFKVVRIDFTGRGPVLSPDWVARPDSAAAAPPAQAKTP